MSLPLFNVPGNILRGKVVTATHDRYNSEGSFRGAAKEACKILNGPILDSIKADLEESESESEGSESPVEELVLTFTSQFHISDNSTQRVKENKIEEFSPSETEGNKSDETSNHVNACFLSETNVAAPSSLFAALPLSARENSISPLPQGSSESGQFTESCIDSTKLKSALRGGFEKLGLGPRPRLHVTWAPDVYEPACTSASHTVSHNHRRYHSKKTDHKHRHKGKVSPSDSRKKLEKKLSRKSRHEGCILRSPAVPFQKGQCGSNTREVAWTEFTVLPYDEHSLKSVKLSSIMLPQSCPLSGMLKSGERRFVTLDARMPLPWHVQPHEVCI